MGVVIVSPPTGLCQENLPLLYVSLVRATYCTEYGHRIGSVHAVIWQAGTNWAGPVRIQIYYGPECRITTWLMSAPNIYQSTYRILSDGVIWTPAKRGSSLTNNSKYIVI